MAQPWLAIPAALLLWWASTGLMLLAVRRADRAGGGAHRLIALSAVPLAALGVAGILIGEGGTLSPIASAYLGFVSALTLWGAIELSFLTGFITGPNRAPCPPGARGAARLWAAWTAIYHHELLLVGGLLMVAVLVAGDPTSVAFGTYLILFAARILAKLNLFAGVPRINLEFVPTPLNHLKSHFRQAPAGPVFGVAVALLVLALVLLARALLSTTDPAAAVELTLLLTLTGLALAEHALMVVPLPDAALWRWMLPKPAAPAPRMTPNER